MPANDIERIVVENINTPGRTSQVNATMYHAICRAIVGTGAGGPVRRAAGGAHGARGPDAAAGAGGVRGVCRAGALAAGAVRVVTGVGQGCPVDCRGERI